MTMGIDYQRLYEYRFRDVGSLGRTAVKALRACLGGGDEPEVKRDASLVLERINEP